MNVYNGTGEGFVKLCGLIGRWGEASHLKLMGQAVRSLWITLRRGGDGWSDTLSIQGYVPVMACNAAMLAMINADRWVALRDLLKVETANADQTADTTILRDLVAGRWEGDERSTWGMYPGQGPEATPHSQTLCLTILSSRGVASSVS